MAPGIAAGFLLGVASNKTTPAAGFSGLLIGFILGMLRLVLKLFSDNLNPEGFLYQTIVAPNWLHYEIVLFFVAVIAMILISTVTKQPDFGEIKGLTFGSASPEQIAETRDSWDMVNSDVIISIVLLFYAYFC